MHFQRISLSPAAVVLVGAWFLAGSLAAAAGPGEARQLPNKVTVAPLGPKVWVHFSVADMGGYHDVSSNGLILLGETESVLIDTPATVAQTETLLAWAREEMERPIKSFIASHSHIDCMGGIQALLDRGVKTYGHRLTAGLARKQGLPPPERVVPEDEGVSLGGWELRVFFPGHGHAPDNLVVWLPQQEILFGGCLVKAAEAKTMGNLGDADLKSWREAIQRVKRRFPTAAIVVPGHGAVGGTELLAHTQRLIDQAR